MIITHKELVRRCIQKGYTLRTNLNPGFMTAINEWAKDKGGDVARLMQAGETKKAIDKLIEAQKLKYSMRADTEKADQLVYDKSGEAIYWYETATGKLLRLETEAERTAGS